jgi:hypothetical protein
MAGSPSNAHAVSAIRERLAKLAGELLAVEKQWHSLREAHNALSHALRTFDPDAGSHPVAPKRPYRRTWPSDKGKLSRLVLDVLRAAERPVTVAEVVAALGGGDGITDMDRRVRVTLNRLTRSEKLVAKEGKRETARWLPGPPAARGQVFSAINFVMDEPKK